MKDEITPILKHSASVNVDMSSCRIWIYFIYNNSAKQNRLHKSHVKVCKTWQEIDWKLISEQNDKFWKMVLNAIPWNRFNFQFSTFLEDSFNWIIFVNSEMRKDHHLFWTKTILFQFWMFGWRLEEIGVRRFNSNTIRWIWKNF